MAQPLSGNRVRRPSIGVGAIVWQGDAVLLIRRGKPPRQGEWSLPGGHQEWGETVEAAVRREVQEEAGLRLGALHFVAIVDLMEADQAGSTQRHYTLLDYTAEAVGGELRAGGDALDAAWFDPAAVASLPLWTKTHEVIAQARRLITQLRAR